MGGLRRLILAALALVSAGALAAPAAAAPAYTLLGLGDHPVRPGILAADADISIGMGAAAIRSDGVVAFETAGDVYWVEAARLWRVPVPAPDVLDLAFAADGALLVSTCGVGSPSAVFRAERERPATIVAGRTGSRGAEGDGGPATSARLRCPEAIDVDAQGGILIADAEARRVRRVRPDGVIETVAGTGGGGAKGDGDPATAAALEHPTDVTALPGGGFAILDRVSESSNELRAVDASGTITTRLTADLTDISAQSDGSLLLTSGFLRDGAVRRLAPDGTLTTVTRPGRDDAGIPRFTPVEGDPFGSADSDVQGAMPTPDGGVLVLSSFAIRYVAPPAPRLLGLAIEPATRRVGRRLTVAVRTTRPARLYAGVWRRGRRSAYLTTISPGGETLLPVRRRLRTGAYSVRVRAEGDGQIVGADVEVLVGGLPLRYARNFVRSRLELLRTFENSQAKLGRCARLGARRVDCSTRVRRRCGGVVSMRLRSDGTVSVASYQSRGCRFRR